MLPKFLLQQVLADIDTSFPFFGFNPLPDPILGLGGLDDLEPVLAGKMVGRGDDFHHVPMLKRGPQGDHFFVDPGPGTMMPHIGMDGIGKINGGSPFRENFNLTLRSKHIDLVGKQIDTDRFQKLPRVLVNFLRFQKLPDPL